MIRKISALVFSTALLMTGSVFAQKTNVVSVDKATGNLTTVIQLHSLSRGKVVFPISIGYSGSGIKVQDGPGDVGMGWQLIAGGKIIRELRGFPDDKSPNGWLHNDSGPKVANFNIANDNTTTTCTDEIADLNYLNNNFTSITDTEPDVFSVTAPGLSCKFVFDNNKIIKTIPYQDLKITYDTDVEGQIRSFTVTNDQGIEYVFSDREMVLRQAASQYPTVKSFFKTDFNLYKSEVKYTSAWHLSSIYDVNGNGVLLHYKISLGALTSSYPIILNLSNPGNLNKDAYQYSIVETRNPLMLESAASAKDLIGNAIKFKYVESLEASPILMSISGAGKNIQFERQYVGLALGVKRGFLTSVYDMVPNSALKYKFGYYGYNSFIPPIDTSLTLPDTSSKQIDYWGYYSRIKQNTSLDPALYINPDNPAFSTHKIQASATAGSMYSYSIIGSGRTADPNRAVTGALNKIVYINEGSTSVEYELNDYFDPSTNTVIKGNGVRVKSLTDYDGINVSNNMVTTYSYIDPATNLSSGSPLTLPIYAFTRPYSGTGTTAEKWIYSTVKSKTNLSSEDNSILYSHVRVSNANSGSTLYEYSKPGMIWDINSVADWSPTINNVARPNCSNSDLTKNDMYTYPFAPNTNYDFERGLLKKEVSYNSTGQPVSETTYTYTRTGLPFVIYGLRIDSNMTSKVYAKYKIYTGSSELLTQQTKKMYDSQTLLQQHASALNYYYESPFHKKLTRETSTNSDGSISSIQTVYTKDYTISATIDSNLLAIKSLQDLNLNIPVEKISRIQQGGVTKVIGADLTKFKIYPGYLSPLNLPAQKLSFVSPNGVTDFQAFSTSTGTGTNDSRYIPKVNFTKYDPYGFLLSMDDNNKNVKTVFLNRFKGLPSAEILNANYNEVVFNDFDDTHNGAKFSFTQDSIKYTENSHTGRRAFMLNAVSVVTAAVAKNALAESYVFSCWINSTTEGLITLSINNNGTIIPYNLSFINNSGIWKYYELKIPATNLAANFNVSLKSNAAAIIDDVLFYPDNASVETFTYGTYTQLKSSEISANGTTRYYSYDPYGRLLLIKDQDKQILLKKSYIRQGNLIDPAESYVNLNFTGTNLYNGQAADFTNTSWNRANADDIVYTWDYGDGTPITTGFNGSHIYTLLGSYTVTLTATSETYGIVSYSKEVIVTTPPIVNLIYDKRGTTGGIIGTIKFLKGSTIVHSFKPFETSTNAIASDIYTVEVQISRGTARSFTFFGKTVVCIPLTSATTTNYTFTVDLRGVVDAVFGFNSSDCN